MYHVHEDDDDHDEDEHEYDHGDDSSCSDDDGDDSDGHCHHLVVEEEEIVEKPTEQLYHEPVVKYVLEPEIGEHYEEEHPLPLELTQFHKHKSLTGPAALALTQSPHLQAGPGYHTEAIEH